MHPSAVPRADRLRRLHPHHDAAEVHISHAGFGLRNFDRQREGVKLAVAIGGVGLGEHEAGVAEGDEVLDGGIQTTGDIGCEFRGSARWAAAGYLFLLGCCVRWVMLGGMGTGLKTLLARASPLRSGDELAGVAARTQEERIRAQQELADVPLTRFLDEPLIPYESDEVTRLILDTHDAEAFARVRYLSVGGFREWLLGYETGSEALRALAPGLTPEMAAATSKLMSNQDLVLVAKKCSVVTRFRNTLGLPGRLAVRLQPNHPTDDPSGIAASTLDGLLMGCGDAVIGINPASDNVASFEHLSKLLAELIETYAIPTQSCVLAHVTTQLRAIESGVPVDLVFQSIAGTEAANASFGVNLKLLGEARAAALALKRGTVGENVMYFETGQGSCLSANAHHGVDQQTLEARAYAVARAYSPLLVNTVVGFIGPEYLADGKQIIRAGLEDHFCGKLLGLPMGCDVCYTNHAAADQDDMDALLTMLGVAGVNYIMGVPGADDVMLSYQSTSFHDAQYLRQALGLRPAPEFEAWLESRAIAGTGGRLLTDAAKASPLSHRLLDSAP